MKSLMLLSALSMSINIFASSQVMNRATAYGPGNKAAEIRQEKDLEVRPNYITCYVDPKHVVELSEALHNSGNDLLKEQATEQANLEKLQKKLEGSFAGVAEEKREEVRTELTLTFKRAQEDAERRLRKLLVDGQKKIEGWLLKGKKHVLATFNKGKSSSAEKVGAIVDKTPDMVCADENDVTEQVAKAIDLLMKEEAVIQNKAVSSILAKNESKIDAGMEKVVDAEKLKDLIRPATLVADASNAKKNAASADDAGSNIA